MTHAPCRGTQSHRPTEPLDAQSKAFVKHTERTTIWVKQHFFSSTSQIRSSYEFCEKNRMYKLAQKRKNWIKHPVIQHIEQYCLSCDSRLLCSLSRSAFLAFVYILLETIIRIVSYRIVFGLEGAVVFLFFPHFSFILISHSIPL